MRKVLLTIAMALSVPVVAGAAMIEGKNAVIKVDTSAYNLTSTAGQEMLYQELKSAARDVCGTTNLRQAGSVELALQNRACVRDALAQAVKDVNNASVSELHSQS